jgi:hypothetical protein
MTRSRGLLAIALVALIGCKKPSSSGPMKLGDDESPPPAKCSTDAECAVVALDHCCHCCRGTDLAPVAKNGPAYVRVCAAPCERCRGPGSEDGRVAVKDGRLSCDDNPRPTDFIPVCRAGRCEAEPKR